MHTGDSDTAEDDSYWRGVIRASKRKLIEWISEDPSELLDELDSKELINRDVYKQVKEISDSKKQSRFLLDHFIDSQEENCKNFLQSLRDVKNNYHPELQDWIENLSGRNKSKQDTYKTSSNTKCTDAGPYYQSRISSSFPRSQDYHDDEEQGCIKKHSQSVRDNIHIFEAKAQTTKAVIKQSNSYYAESSYSKEIGDKKSTSTYRISSSDQTNKEFDYAQRDGPGEEQGCNKQASSVVKSTHFPSVPTSQDADDGAQADERSDKQGSIKPTSSCAESTHLQRLSSSVPTSQDADDGDQTDERSEKQGSIKPISSYAESTNSQRLSSSVPTSQDADDGDQTDERSEKQGSIKPISSYAESTNSQRLSSSVPTSQDADDGDQTDERSEKQGSIKPISSYAESTNSQRLSSSVPTSQDADDGDQTDERSEKQGSIKPISSYAESTNSQSVLGRNRGGRILEESELHSNQDTVEKIVSSKVIFQTIMKKLNLDKFYPQKISINHVLSITGYEEYPKSLEEISKHFLNNIMRANPKARTTENGKCRMEYADPSDDDLINPLDMITAVFLCADSFLQQVLMQKMAQCQFALPLLLPDSGKGDVTFMLWAMRQIVKNWKLQKNASSMEESLVSIQMPFISFIRVGECSVSKSKLLNSILSNDNHDLFVHRDVECGDIPRKCSDGLVEMAMFCPCGKSNIDVFEKAFGILNLRGDARDHLDQLKFLKAISNAMFIVIDGKVDGEEMSILADSKAQLFIITNQKENSRSSNTKAFTDTLSQLKIKATFIEKGRHNDTAFTKKLRSDITIFLQSTENHETLERMVDVVGKLNIRIDERKSKCIESKDKVNSIMNIIEKSRVKESKQRYLPLQGDLWHNWAETNKEQSRVKHIGRENFEDYIIANKNKQTDIRKQQKEIGFSDVMKMFVDLILNESIEMKMFVLQWMQLKLNNLSRVTFSKLRDDYKKIYVHLDVDSKINAKKLEEIEELMSSSSLGLEHFIREIGQFYEATKAVQKYAVPNTKESAYRKALTLPAVAAELFLEGFPLELMDGDVGCIPIDWVTDVLKEVRATLGRDPRVFVLTVLGVQSTGKSTLLNTMFGLQFTVSSGRCTRGAFMQLISIEDHLKQELECDFILVIDTEGLKAPELATLHDSYEHDNELATVVIGLSDVTLINLAMENVEEMKDVLQIVVHAFLRMTEVGKKTKCLFVHQNSGDVAASDKNMRDKKCLINQLNAMTVAAARMEHKESTYSKFTDVMEHDVSQDNWYIPGLWHGTPPMASVSAAYSDQVFQLKQHLIDHLKKRPKTQRASTLKDFSTWIGSIWEAVKKENFIFSFKNSLVADAYNQLCIQYTGWEWEFRNDIISWTQEQNNYINSVKYDHLHNHFQQLECELSNEILKGKATLQSKIKSHFENKSQNVHLVEKYKEDFNISAKQLCVKLQEEALNKFLELVCRRQSGHSIEELETQSKKIIGSEVCKLLQRCKDDDVKLNEIRLNKEFNDMWSNVVTHLPKINLTKHDVYSDMVTSLRDIKLEHASAVSHLLCKFGSPATYFEKNRNKIFQLNPEHFIKDLSKLKPIFNIFTKNNDATMKELTNISHMIIESSNRYIKEKIKMNDYCSSYNNDLLQHIHKELEQQQNQIFTKDFSRDITVFICFKAIVIWQKAHDISFENNNPTTKINNIKNKFFVIFKELCRQGDDNIKHAKTFCDGCLKPSLLEAVDNKLGMDIATNVKSDSGGPTFSSRKHLQLAMYLHLLDEDNFETHYRYINKYADFTKEWIMAEVINHCQRENGSHSQMYHLSSAILSNLINEVKKSVDFVTKTITTPTTLLEFADSLGECLLKHIIINKDVIDVVGSLSFKDKESVKQFSEELKSSLDSAEEEMLQGFSVASDTECEAWLSRLSVQPHIELYKSLAGCEKQCPFCRVPCDQGGGGHETHSAELHYPQGLNGVSIITNDKLVAEVCTTDVAGNRDFKSSATNDQWVPYKEYRTINDYFASWSIQPDTSLEATTFWKVVFCKYNRNFAERHHVSPADIPNAWKEIDTDENKMKEDLIKSFALTL
ncbi:interferon-induced very large GTPase 1-like isoform X2 [Petromyzon marinus]|uniref:interferon-induced very large GTPase 1-like isoform X2 n=1 Tax=Petromyzon marinus TaxID=7757 RepID=UPI003F6E9268